MKNEKGQHRQPTKGIDFENAMSQAFSEIFKNLKGMEEDTKKRRIKAVPQRRRSSAPASAFRETFGTTTHCKQPQKELDRTKSAPTFTLPAVPALSTMHWVMQCCEEEEDIRVIDSSFSFLDNY